MKDFTRLLIDACARYGISLDEESSFLMVRYLEEIYRWNERVNLTSIPYGPDALYLHVLDSLLPLSLLAGEEVQGEFLDIGTGGGFPGVPFGIATGLHGTLLDSVGKKVAVVHDALSAVGLSENLEPVHDRAETFAKDNAGRYAYVLSRAVASLEIVLEYATPLTGYGNSCIIYKARTTEEEFSDAMRAAEMLGLSLVSRETFTLPHDLGQRDISIWRRISEPSIKIPRRIGLAKKRPLSSLLK